MKQLPNTKIFLADERGLSNSAYFATYHTFNFGQFQNEFKKPFHRLKILNDVNLAANQSIKMGVDSSYKLILLPLMGGLEYKINGVNDFIESGKLKIFDILKNDQYEVINPYGSETINYLEICIETDLTHQNTNEVSIEFIQKNQLIAITDIGTIGIFAGRQKGKYLLKNAGNAVFTTIISGAFEVNECLLHAKDSLAQSGVEMVEFEALSEDAIILILELSLDKLTPENGTFSKPENCIEGDS